MIINRLFFKVLALFLARSFSLFSPIPLFPTVCFFFNHSPTLSPSLSLPSDLKVKDFRSRKNKKQKREKEKLLGYFSSRRCFFSVEALAVFSFSLPLLCFLFHSQTNPLSLTPLPSLFTKQHESLHTQTPKRS